MEVAAVFLPLAGFLIAGLFGRVIGDRGAMAVTVAFMVAAALASLWLFWAIAVGGEPRTVHLFTWIRSGELEIAWALRMDTLTAVMLVVVNGVSALVHVYSIGYMSHDPHRARFFAYLSLFTFAMLMLVTADNLVQMFFGWEGVGLASYLLIGFWYEKDSANNASIKAFVVNRVGDFGFILGICAIFFLFGSLDFDTIFAASPGMAEARFSFLGMEVHALTCIGLLLFIGAMGKSAQLGLHTWLPDAMEGPTPVSALIHAATMVTAGVFMLARMSPMLEYAPDALAVVAVVGALTAFVGATIGLTQTDIKRVIAYSTMSQLGYMFFAIGVSAYQAAIFHLATHAFFKALLFLGAGSVIHAMSGEQDMRRMGGLRTLIPKTYWLMVIGSLALAGIGVPYVFGMAGYYSKDIVLEAAWASGLEVGVIAFVLGVAAAFLTAFYSWRLLLLTFHGAPRANERVMAHVHESPWVMLGPLVVLAVGAIVAGALGYSAFVGYGREAFWGESIFILAERDSVEAAHHVALWVRVLPVAVAVAGIALAYHVYADLRRPKGMAESMEGLYLLSYRKWFFDELYDWTVVRPALVLGRILWRRGDLGVIDRFGPDGLAQAAREIARRSSRLQSGYLYHYAFAMLIGVVAFVSWYLFFARG